MTDLGHDAATDVDASRGKGSETHVAGLGSNEGQEHVHSLHRYLVTVVAGGF